VSGEARVTTNDKHVRAKVVPCNPRTAHVSVRPPPELGSPEECRARHRHLDQERHHISSEPSMLANPPLSGSNFEPLFDTSDATCAVLPLLAFLKRELHHAANSEAI
jgi:hypothetical protein